MSKNDRNEMTWVEWENFESKCSNCKNRMIWVRMPNFQKVAEITDIKCYYLKCDLTMLKWPSSTRSLK